MRASTFRATDTIFSNRLNMFEHDIWGYPWRERPSKKQRLRSLRVVPSLHVTKCQKGRQKALLIMAQCRVIPKEPREYEAVGNVSVRTNLFGPYWKSFHQEGPQIRSFNLFMMKAISQDWPSWHPWLPSQVNHSLCHMVLCAWTGQDKKFALMKTFHLMIHMSLLGVLKLQDMQLEVFCKASMKCYQMKVYNAGWFCVVLQGIMRADRGPLAFAWWTMLLLQHNMHFSMETYSAYWSLIGTFITVKEASRFLTNRMMSCS